MFVGTLAKFQEEAVEMMLDLKTLLLAATMGAGKTVITIAALERLIDSGQAQHGLIIVPASLKFQWYRRIEQFTDGATAVVIDGTKPRRERMYRRYARIGEYCILNYEQVVNDWEIVSALPYDFVVADEVQAIKNFKAQRSKALKALDAGYRFGLTGQPVENRPEEVYSIMEMVEPGHLGNFHVFDRTFIVRNNFGGVERYRNLDTFHERLSERMFRVSDKDIAEQLPGLAEEPEYLRFDRISRKAWRHIAEDLLTDLEEIAEMGGSGWTLEKHYGRDDDSGDMLAARGRIMAKVGALRMLADHPQLLVESAAKYLDPDTKDGSAYAAGLMEFDWFAELPKTSVKYRRSMELITDLVEAGTKVVLFSTFKATLRWLLADLAEAGVTAVRFDGDMTAKEKDAAQQQFLDDPETMVFLASDAGGTGVDLPNASVLINYDLPWSAGLYAQRNARIRRLSSEHARVVIVNLLVEDSIDIRQHDMLVKKNEVANAIVDGEYNDDAEVQMDLGSLKDFIKETLEH